MRTDHRRLDQLRSIEIELNPIKHAEGSALIKMGDTHVLCTATVEEQIPKWRQNSGAGWVSAEYSMLPRSTHTRIKRDKAMSSGRSLEISRLIARSLRSCVDLAALGERAIMIDCDVLQADGGTRTASINGGYIAMALAMEFLVDQGTLEKSAINGQVAAISTGLLGGEVYVDLNYDEDSSAATDMNFVMNENHDLIEVQGTAESGAFSAHQMMRMLDLATKACQEIFSLQNRLVTSSQP